MKKLAIFVEGGSEMDFLERLIGEIAGRNNVVFECRRISGGVSVPRKVVTIKLDVATGSEQFYVLLVNCQGDQQVATRIREEHASLSSNGYEKILGLRDVRPRFTLAELPKLEAGLAATVNRALIPVEFILSVMEFEAWLLAETTHYPKIDPALTAARVHGDLGFDPGAGDLSDRPDPAFDLNAAYNLVGKVYDKHLGLVPPLLDYGEVYVTLPTRISYVQRLVQNIDNFLTPAQV